MYVCLFLHIEMQTHTNIREFISYFYIYLFTLIRICERETYQDIRI